MSKELKCKIIEFEPGQFHVYIKPGLFWRQVGNLDRWTYDWRPCAYGSKQAAEECIRRQRDKWADDMERKRFQPREWLYPPNKIKDDC